VTSTENTPATTPMWWSATGALRCRDHLPLPGSDSWWHQNWTLLPPQDRARLQRLNGRAACETCATADGADPKTNAHAAYLAARVRVARAITALAEHLDILDAGEDIAQTDWSYAGTFNHVAATIETLIPSNGGDR
jgi:hypothetical protein